MAKSDKSKVKEFKRIIDTTNSMIGRFEQNIRFLQGVLLGLFYGIVGNVLVSYSYGMLQGLVNSKFDTFFWANLIVSIASMILIVVVSRKYYYEYREIKALKERLLDARNEIYRKYLEEFGDLSALSMD